LPRLKQLLEKTRFINYQLFPGRALPQHHAHQEHMKVIDELNKRDFTNRNDGTKAVTSTNRFVYSYTGFTELGTHSETDFQVYCTRSFSQFSSISFLTL